jgi:hypothetical protein
MLRVALLLPLVLGACHAVEPTYAAIESNVFLLSCATASCHSTRGRAGGLDLSAGKGYEALVGVAADNEAAKADGLVRVSPGHPELSFLVTKVGTGALDAKYGTHMPNIGDPLDDDARWAIGEWIRLGAKHD